MAPPSKRPVPCACPSTVTRSLARRDSHSRAGTTPVKPSFAACATGDGAPEPTGTDTAHAATNPTSDARRRTSVDGGADHARSLVLQRGNRRAALGDQVDRRRFGPCRRCELGADPLVVVVGREPRAPPADHRRDHPPEGAQPALDLADVVQQRARDLRSCRVRSGGDEPAGHLRGVLAVDVVHPPPQADLAGQQVRLGPHLVGRLRRRRRQRDEEPRHQVVRVAEQVHGVAHALPARTARGWADR